MKQEHYPSFELCKKLTEAWFRWTERIINDDWKFDYPDCDAFACPSVMELLDELPERIDKWQYYYLFTEWLKDVTIYYWYNTEFDWVEILEWTLITWLLPNALAEMWLWCKENNYLP